MAKKKRWQHRISVPANLYFDIITNHETPAASDIEHRLSEAFWHDKGFDVVNDETLEHARVYPAFDFYGDAGKQPFEYTVEDSEEFEEG